MTLKITELITDNMDNNDYETHNMVYPSFETIENAIKKLDAKRYTILTLNTGGDSHMCIGGGSGRYIVYCTFNNEDFYSLVSNANQHGTTLLMVGGQEGDYNNSMICDLDMTIKATKTFYEEGELNNNFKWDQS